MKTGVRSLAYLAVCVTLLSTAGAESMSDPVENAVVRSTPVAPGVRFTSGLMVCDEELYDGRWVNRYWTSTGQIKPDIHLENQSQNRAGLAIDAFRLGIEGQNLAGTWKLVDIEQKHLAAPDGQLVTIEFRSNARPITVKLNTLMHGESMMIRWLDITNTGAKPTAITSVSPWSGMLWDTDGYKERVGNEAPFEVETAQYEVWGHEGAWDFHPVGSQTISLSGTRGRSGWGHPTFFARNRATGEWFVASLAWSGNWTMHLTGTEDQEKGDARLFFDLGPSAADPVLRVLAPGETVRSPETHLLLMRGDLDKVIQTLLYHVRHYILPPLPPGRSSLVEANHRGYIVNHESEEGIKNEVDIAAHIGADTFVVDAGWNGPEPNEWWNNAGDWRAGSWLPHDLNPVREYARKKGMLFGLWVEIESVGAAAKLRRDHPDWILTRNGEPVANGRLLDFANPEVAAWAEGEIARIIKQYDLDIFRLDYNSTPEEGGNRLRDGFLENTQWRHVEAIYAMFDHLRKQFPNVIFQNCAAGGGRLDWGMMQRFQNTELSDWLRAPRGLKILNGITWLLPPEILLRTFGTESSGLEEDGNLNLQLDTLMMSRPIFRGISPTLPELNPLLGRKIVEKVEFYKQTAYPVMANSLVYHHTPVLPMMEPSPWVVLEYAAPDGRKEMVGLFRTSQAGDPVYKFEPRGLDFSKSYSVHFGNSGQTVEISGTQLLQTGIEVRLDENLSSQLLVIEQR
jgi:alpha-galactosidase